MPNTQRCSIPRHNLRPCLGLGKSDPVRCPPNSTRVCPWYSTSVPLATTIHGCHLELFRARLSSSRTVNTKPDARVMTSKISSSNGTSITLSLLETAKSVRTSATFCASLQLLRLEPVPVAGFIRLVPLLFLDLRSCAALELPSPTSRTSAMIKPLPLLLPADIDVHHADVLHELDEIRQRMLRSRKPECNPVGGVQTLHA